MKSNVLQPLVQGITTELDEPIITEDGVDNLIIENELNGGWTPPSATLTYEAQTGASVYNGVLGAVLQKKDLGDGVDWVTIEEGSISGNPYYLLYSVTQNNTGASRTVGIRAVDGQDNPVFIITQNEYQNLGKLDFSSPDNSSLMNIILNVKS